MSDPWVGIAKIVPKLEGEGLRAQSTFTTRGGSTIYGHSKSHFMRASTSGAIPPELGFISALRDWKMNCRDL